MPGPVVITGGGTGGHVFPMQAIADRLHAKGLELGDLRFVGSQRGQERVLLADSGVQLTLLRGRGIKRSFRVRALIDNVGAVIGLIGAVFVALGLVHRWRPSVVVSVGGYASFAISFAAVCWRRPLVLVDLDASAGASHRLLGRFATVRCCAFASSERHAVVTGAPLRDEIIAVNRSTSARRAARAAMDPSIDEGRRVVVVMTGSLGATRVNRAVSDLAHRWADRSDVTIIHVTGRRDFESVHRSAPETNGLDYRIVEFGDMVALWAVCDVAVCRAGAATVAELTALSIAAVLVPLPNAPGDHQTKNAIVVAEAGGAIVVSDERCDAASLAGALDQILVPTTLDAMQRRAGSLGRRESSDAIAQVVMEVGRW